MMFVGVRTDGCDIAALKETCSYPKHFPDVLVPRCSQVLKAGLLRELFWLYHCSLENIFSSRVRDDLFLHTGQGMPSALISACLEAWLTS